MAGRSEIMSIIRNWLPVGPRSPEDRSCGGWTSDRHVDDTILGRTVKLRVVHAGPNPRPGRGSVPPLPEEPVLRQAGGEAGSLPVGRRRGGQLPRPLKQAGTDRRQTDGCRPAPRTPTRPCREHGLVWAGSYGSFGPHTGLIIAA